MRILFTFENPLPNNAADAEVFVTTARCLAPLLSKAWLHVPLPRIPDPALTELLAGLHVVRAWAPQRPAGLRHLCCGLTLVLRREFRQADLIYTRNLWIAWVAILFGQRVAFDHYRPWPDQVPPLQPWIQWLLCRDRFLINICHSDYTRQIYLRLGISLDKLHCVRNGFDPRRLQDRVPLDVAKREISVAPAHRTVVYAGRLNHKKGLDLVLDAAERLPQILFLLVGATGEGAIEARAASIANIRLVPWQAPEALGRYVFAADVLLIPPSWKPLAEFGSTVLPLKLFFYMASGRPILAGDTPDVREVLEHGRNAILCRPDSVEALVEAITTLTTDAGSAARLAEAALADSAGLTWAARARRIEALVRDRLRAPPSRAGGRDHMRSRLWRRRTFQWMAHVLRTGSWVLPPDPVVQVPTANE